jgi:hypothetical protein
MTMTDQQRPEPDDERDSSEVVTGPIGDANLVDPKEAETLGADLNRLPGVEIEDPDEGINEGS